MNSVKLSGEMLEAIREEIPQNALGKIEITLVELNSESSIGVIFDVGYGRKYVQIDRGGIAHPEGGLAAPDWAHR